MQSARNKGLGCKQAGVQLRARPRVNVSSEVFTRTEPLALCHSSRISALDFCSTGRLLRPTIQYGRFPNRPHLSHPTGQTRARYVTPTLSPRELASPRGSRGVPTREPSLKGGAGWGRTFKPLWLKCLEPQWYRSSLQEMKHAHPSLPNLILIHDYVSSQAPLDRLT